MLRISRRITSRFDVLGRSLMYLKLLTQLVLIIEVSPSPLSLFACPQVFVFKALNAGSVLPSKSAFALSTKISFGFLLLIFTSIRLFTSLIALTPFNTCGQILIGLIILISTLHLLSLICLATHCEILRLHLFISLQQAALSCVESTSA